MDASSPKRDPRLIFVAGILAMALIGGGIAIATKKDAGAAGASGGCESVATPAGRNLSLAPPPPKTTTATQAVVKTNCGSFTIALDTARAPKTATSFAYLAEQGAYDDTAFTRVAPGFLIQGGDPTGTEQGDAGYSIQETPPADLTYSRGTVAMAKSGSEPAGTSGSAFFVVTGNGGPSLPPDYALVGKVTDGLDTTVKAIEAAGTLGGDGPPTFPVVIQSVTVS